VLEHEGAIVGCGGYALSPPSARLVGISIRPDARRQGLGRYLLMYCLREIGKAGGIDVVTVEAPPESAGFLESQGFRPAGSATYIKKLTVCA
jgi:N-acetylglutamate synthase-like GNAT family acetyltransferase